MSRRLRSVIASLVLLVCTPLCASEYSVLLEKSFRPDNTRLRALSLARASDGGYLVAGKASTDAFVIKIGRDFGKQWEQYLEGRDVVHEANTVIPTANGGALIAGHTYLPYGSGASIDIPFATQIDQKGAVLWTKLYGTRESSSFGRFACGTQTNRGVLLVGPRDRWWTNQPTSTGKALGIELWIAHLDDAGNVLW